MRGGGGRGGATIIPPITEERVNDSVTDVLGSCKFSCDQLGWARRLAGFMFGLDSLWI